MKYLLIDFGASYIKCVEYDSETESYYNQSIWTSPFKTNSTITKQELRIILDEIVLKHHTVNRILICTILGGSYDGDLYHSWKSNIQVEPTSCLIGGLFVNEPTFHIHEHHAKVFKMENFESELRIIGYLDNKPVYSPLGDTDCVINSIDANSADVILNMGTGSQVIKRGERKSFIPSGRAFLTFADFFKEFGVDMFDRMSQLSIDEIVNSSLEVNLNVFPQSYQFTGGGSIHGILEGTFTPKNFFASLLRSYVDQYHTFISDKECNRIILTGGIPKKLPLIHQYFSLKYPEKTIVLDNNAIENTHRGMVNYIREFL